MQCVTSGVGASQEEGQRKIKRGSVYREGYNSFFARKIILIWEMGKSDGVLLRLELKSQNSESNRAAPSEYSICIRDQQ
jgi:hypothetical protein